MFDSIKNKFSVLVETAKAITWPTRSQLLKASLAVLIISVIIGGYLLLLDMLFYNLRSTVIN